MSTLKMQIVVPVYNEEGHLEVLASSLGPSMDGIVGVGSWGFIFVNNGSTDGSAKSIDGILLRYPGSTVVNLDKADYGSALHAGLMSSEASYTAIINVDFWDPEFLRWSWVNRHSYDLILGSKRADPTLNQQSRYRRTLSWGLNVVLQFAFGYLGSDTHGQKFLRMSAIRPVLALCRMRRGQYDTEFTLRSMRLGLRLAEVPVPIIEVRAQRNWMVRKILQNLLDVIRLKIVMSEVGYTRSIRYHRWAREDVINSQEKEIGSRSQSEKLL